LLRSVSFANSESIHLSLAINFNGEVLVRGKDEMNLERFHSLVRNLCAPAILSSEHLKSEPWVASDAHQNLNESAPNLSKIGAGSTTFPLLLCIAWPCSSIPSPPTHACLNGERAVSW